MENHKGLGFTRLVRQRRLPLRVLDNGPRAFVCAAVLSLIGLVACDPGMSISQSAIQQQSGITVNIKTTHQLIGETWYAPTLTITNSFDTPVIVTGFTLQAGGKTYADKRIRPQDLPLKLQPSESSTVGAWFDLHESVKQALFRKPGEIQVHFTSDGQEGIVRAIVIGGSL